MADIADLLDGVMPEVPGCSVAYATRECRNTVLDFLERTKIMRRTISGIDHPGEDPLDMDTDLALASHERVVDVLAGWWFGAPLTVCSAKEAAEESPTWQEDVGTPRFLTVEDNLLYVWPAPEAITNDALTLRVAIGGNQTLATIPTVIFEKYREELECGAKGRLLAKPKKPWTDAGIAQEYLRVYNRAVDVATVRAAKGGGTLRTSPSWC